MADGGALLVIVYRTIATRLAHKTGFTKPLAQTGAVTPISSQPGSADVKSAMQSVSPN
jgi:hypothetical protein